MTEGKAGILAVLAKEFKTKYILAAEVEKCENQIANDGVGQNTNEGLLHGEIRFKQLNSLMNQDKKRGWAGEPLRT